MLRARFIRCCFRHPALWLATLAIAVPVSAAPVEETHTVRRGDTLCGIARKNEISVARLAERNGISRNGYVYTGQRLVIPANSTNQTARTLPGMALPSSVQRAIDKADVKPGRWKYIVIHHSGVDTGTVKAMDRYHREVRHMENGLAYHFVIGNGDGMDDGEIAAGSRWTRQLDGGHLISESQNKVSLDICLVGNFDKHKPTAKQLQRLTALVQALLTRCKLSPNAVRTYQQINVVPTRCPGRHFPTKSFPASLKAKLMNVAVLGASNKPERYSFQAVKLLAEKGHAVFPVHPALVAIDGVPAFKQLADIPFPIHTLTMYVGTERSTALAAAILATRPQRVIFNPGAENPGLAAQLQATGIDVWNACTLVLLRTGQFDPAKPPVHRAE
jgi:predicted CoA-binding protein